MGEAKKRREKDRFYGMVPKQGKGIIIPSSQAIDVKNNSVAGDSGVDAAELRRCILFWDRIVVPQNRAWFGAAINTDVQFLIDTGILKSPLIEVDRGISRLSDYFVHSYINAFTQLEREEPGLWAVSDRIDGWMTQGSSLVGGRGAMIKLYNAIPLPDLEVPLEDLLNFKEKRIDEVRQLTMEMDKFYSDVSN